MRSNILVIFRQKMLIVTSSRKNSTHVCVILHDSLPSIPFFRLYPKKFYWKSSDFRKHKCNVRFTNRILASNENSQLSNAERNASITNKFSFLIFLFSNCEQRSKKSFQFWNSVHTRLNSKRFQRNFQKKGRDVNYPYSHISSLAFQKN